MVDLVKERSVMTYSTLDKQKAETTLFKIHSEHF